MFYKSVHTLRINFNESETISTKTTNKCQLKCQTSKQSRNTTALGFEHCAGRMTVEINRLVDRL